MGASMRRHHGRSMPGAIARTPSTSRDWRSTASAGEVERIRRERERFDEPDQSAKHHRAECTRDAASDRNAQYEQVYAKPVAVPPRSRCYLVHDSKLAALAEGDRWLRHVAALTASQYPS